MTGPSFRCSRASLDAGDDLAGTASTVRSFLLVEAEGAWGSAALEAKLLPEPVRGALRELERRHKVRPLLVRRAGRPSREAAPVNVFIAHTGHSIRWVEHARLDRYEDLLELDLSGIHQGERPGLSPYDGSLFLVCTHGRHDACCAERGRPVWQALRHLDPEHTWQVTHIGGDRFAANVIVLPDGLYYGRMEPQDATRLLTAQRDGRLLLDRLRGRTSLAFPVQAAEVFLRRALDLTGDHDLELRRQQRDGVMTSAVFAGRGGSWQVRVRSTAGEPRRLTCSGRGVSAPLRHELVDIVQP